MKTFSEIAGAFAGLTLFLGTLIVAHAYVQHHQAVQVERSEIHEGRP